MRLERRVEPEMLDGLAPDDARAHRARRDLRRVNYLMGHGAIWRRLLGAAAHAHPPRSIAELGAGDGTLLLRIARMFAPQWPEVTIDLVDKTPAVSTATLAAFVDLGWRARSVPADAAAWLDRAGPVDVIVANLLLHHFDAAALATLLAKIARRTRTFAACEPRRSRLALLGSQLLGLVGCGQVARYDAVVSVHAGFSDGELTALWPSLPGWRLDEGPAGLFSHGFVAWHPPP